MNWPNRIVSAPLMRRHDQLTAAVLARQVDRQAQVDVRRGDTFGLPSTSAKCRFMFGNFVDRLHDRVAEQVGERDLPAAGALEVVVDDDAVVDHQLGRDGAHAGRGRHVQRRVHVLHDGGGGAAQRLASSPSRGRGPGRRPSAWRVRPRGLALRGGGLGLAGAGLGGGGGRWPLRPALGRARRSGGAAGAAGCRCRSLHCRWSVRGSSRRGIRANWDRPRRDLRGTCGTSPRPTTRSVRMVKLNCSRQLLASIPSVRRASGRTLARGVLPACGYPAITPPKG